MTTKFSRISNINMPTQALIIVPYTQVTIFIDWCI